MKTEQTVSSETSAIRTQTPGNYPKRNKLKGLFRLSQTEPRSSNPQTFTNVMDIHKGVVGMDVFVSYENLSAVEIYVYWKISYSRAQP